MLITRRFHLRTLEQSPSLMPLLFHYCYTWLDRLPLAVTTLKKGTVISLLLLSNNAFTIISV
jgi:hypothetical protein